MSVAGVSLKFRFRAVSYLSWLEGGWDFCGSFGVVALLISFLSHQRIVSSQGYTWSSLHKWQNTVVGTVYIMFVCLFVVHKSHKCIQGTWKWKHMIYGHFLSEFEKLNNDSFVNFEKQNCNSSFVYLSFETIFWETGFVNLRWKPQTWSWSRGNLASVVLLIIMIMIGGVSICLKISQTKTDSCFE